MKNIHISIFGAALIALISFSSCEVTEEVSHGSVEAPKHLQIKQINQDNLLGNGDELVGIGKGMTIQTAEEWEALRTKMNSVNPSQDEVSIDFELTTVLAYFDYIRTSGGHSVQIVEVMETTDGLQARFKTSAPEGNVIEIMTQPFHIVSIPKNTKPVKFVSALTE